MSKIHELRKRALEAVRDRDWNRAVPLYERICTVDSGNGSPRNELGDIYLKLSDVDKAIESFQEAARLYQEYGLTNNAVAVHKKILRHDPNHLHSFWVLGEIRLHQGLDAEASASFMDFLARAESVPESQRDAFVARALELLDRLGDDPEILSRLDVIFAKYDRGQERSQVLVAKARLAHEAGEFDVRDKYIEHARVAFTYLDALPEYVQLRAIVDGEPERARSGPHERARAAYDPQPDDSGAEEGRAAEPGSGLADVEELVLEPPSGGITISEQRNLDIDLGFDFDETELSGVIERVSGAALARSPEAEPETALDPPVDAVPVRRDEPAVVEATIDLLSEILADGSFDSQDAEQRQLETIEQEMMGQIGSRLGEGDHAGQYELGIVYMDMGLYEQAAEAFARASESDADRLRAIEMQGTCLLRLQRSGDAMRVFQAGLAVPGYPGRSYLGLLYGVGLCHEAQSRVAESIDYFERVAAVDDGFLDVGARLRSLRSNEQV